MKKFALLSVAFVFLSGNYVCSMEKRAGGEASHYESLSSDSSIKKLNASNDLAFYEIYFKD